MAVQQVVHIMKQFVFTSYYILALIIQLVLIWYNNVNSPIGRFFTVRIYHLMMRKDFSKRRTK